uniref:Uncharacterized protein n=1 Tax=Panagrolaimus superbus TaxID=310955 RepID=A0A914YKC7_9BILA
MVLFSLYPAFVERDLDFFSSQKENAANGEFSKEFQDKHMGRLIFRYKDSRIPDNYNTPALMKRLQDLRDLVHGFTLADRRLEFLRNLDLL